MGRGPTALGIFARCRPSRRKTYPRRFRRAYDPPTFPARGADGASRQGFGLEAGRRLRGSLGCLRSQAVPGVPKTDRDGRDDSPTPPSLPDDRQQGQSPAPAASERRATPQSSGSHAPRRRLIMSGSQYLRPGLGKSSQFLPQPARPPQQCDRTMRAPCVCRMPRLIGCQW